MDPQNRHRGGDAHTRLLCHNQQREHCITEWRRGRIRVIVRQPKRKRTRGRRRWLSGSRIIQVVDGESGSASLSLDAEIIAGLTPAAEVIASVSDSGVTGARTCWN